MVILRRVSQILFLIAFVYVLWSTTYPLTGWIDPQLLFKLDPLAIFFISLCHRLVLPGFILSVSLIALTLILGRFFCGWVCPLGTVSDALTVFCQRTVLKDRVNARIRKIKFVILVLIAFFALWSVQIAWIFDPLVILARFVSVNFIPATTVLIDGVFVFVIKNLHLYEGDFYDLYRSLKTSFLGINIYSFDNSFAIFAYFMSIILLGVLLRRAWCRILCPLGALYALSAKPALLERQVGDCANCQRCRKLCRMGAIRDNYSYAKGECILCMDCVYDCPRRETRFGWKKFSGKSPRPIASSSGRGITRKDFLVWAASAFSALGLSGFKTPAQKNSLPGNPRCVIRPPGALKEDQFVDRCIRCGNCMKVCITNGLQPVSMESGLEGIWTPQLVPEVGYCEYGCTLCGNVCPTKAIPKLALAVKQKTRIGIAVINRTICPPWAQNKECIVCEEHCPISDKAIKADILVTGGRSVVRPIVLPDLCNGCGICQNVCPVRPVRAIRVSAI